MSSLLFVLGMLCVVTGFPSYRSRRDVTYSKCENTYDQCSEWRKNGLCELDNYKEYMTMQCPVACGLCQQDAAGKLEPSRDTSSSSIIQSYNPVQAQSAIPQSTSDSGYQNAQVAGNSQYNPVADSAPYVPPAAANPDVPSTVEKQSDVTFANSQFNSNLLKSVANKDMVSELRKVSMDKVVTEEINEGTNENDVSSSKHIEKEKLNDTNEVEVKQQRLEVKHKPKMKTKSVKTVHAVSHEGSGFHPGSSGDGSGTRPVDPVPENLSDGESGSGSGGVDFDENFDELIDLVGEGIDDDLEPEDLEPPSPHANSETRLSSTGGETFVSRSTIATPDSVGPEESGSGSAEGTEENDKSEANTENVQQHQTSNTETQEPHKAPEEDEKAEKYEDSEEENNNESIQATKDSQKDYKKANQNKDTSSGKQNLLGKMVDSGKLKAYAVKKEKSHEAKEEENTQGEERSLSAADIGLSSSGSGESGSGEEPNSLQVILKQGYDSKYGNVNTPAFQILAGNFENDVEEALGGDSEVSDIAFSEAEIEGNPRVIGKVKVTFKFKGDYQKLQKLVDTGNINGMLVVKNSLEGSIFDH